MVGSKSLLIFTQTLDRSDPVLGFFHRWVEELSKSYDSLIVVCLSEGDHVLPSNVQVHSLGKNEGKGRITYIARLYRYAFQFRNQYDAVFVHMNQEYIVLAGPVWQLFKKPIYLWRNHHAGNIFTDIAALYCRKIFCTSKYSYTAKFKKTVLMPVGIDTQTFTTDMLVTKINGSILMLGRIAPSKRPHILIEALMKLDSSGTSYEVDFVGDALQRDIAYYKNVKDKAERLGKKVRFLPAIANTKTPEVYRSHEIFVNTSSSGMYDKTIFEAMACGSLVLASNKNLEGEIDKRLVFEEMNSTQLASKLLQLLEMDLKEKNALRESLKKYVATNHSLKALSLRLVEEIL